MIYDATARRRKKLARDIGGKAVELVVLLVVLAVTLIPIIWGVATSFKPRRELFLYPPSLVGSGISFEHYDNIFKSGFWLGVRNSAFYSGASILLVLLLGVPAAYGFQRCRFRGKKLLFYFVVAGIPLSAGSSVLLIPNYTMMSMLQMIDRWYTLILIYTAYQIPMSIWIIRSGVEAVPIEIDEAATIDGCSHAYIIFCLTPRLILPSIASAALFTFIGSWNEFIVGSVMLNNPDLRSIQQVIYYFLGFFGTDWGALCASACMAILPILVVFIFLGRLMISGLTQGAVKG
ncbi:MAG: carbohydrate ABC transporter permease [Candidatus Limiplasma sp.]|nr:carbohydrate ABC transporter permease [Candidatus Limiplasma sp.]